MGRKGGELDGGAISVGVDLVEEFLMAVEDLSGYRILLALK